MSVTYGLSSDGYVKKNFTTVMSEVFTHIHSLDPRVNTGKGTWIWMTYTIWSTKYVELDQIIEDAADTCSITASTGVWLDYHGVESGVFRQSSTRATVNIYATGPANEFVISENSVFSTKNGIQYSTTADRMLPKVIAIQRSEFSHDDIPEPYSSVTSIDWINTTSSQSGTSYTENSDWTFSNDRITWVGSSPAEGTIYFIGLVSTEEVTVKIPAISVLTGSGVSVTSGMITENTNGLSGINSVSCDDSIGGYDIEPDALYKKRLVRSSRVQMGYKRIDAIVGELSYVRAVKSYQVTGVDVATPDSFDWDVGPWTGYTCSATHEWGSVPTFAQTWKPTGDRITLKYISFFAKKVGSPPPLALDLYWWAGSYNASIQAGKVNRRTRYFNAEDVDPDLEYDWQEINVPCRYGGLDWTKTYMFVMEAPSSDANNKWKFKRSTSDEYSNGVMFKDGSMSTVIGTLSTADIAFKTRWGGAGYNVKVAMLQGENFSDHVDDIEDEVFDWEGNRSYSPISIEAFVEETDKVYVNVTCKIFIDDEDDFDEVSDKARTNINSYINSLEPGENVVFSRIEKEILNTAGVQKILNCTIQRNNETAITKSSEKDIIVYNDEIAELDNGVYGPGVNFVQGVW